MTTQRCDVSSLLPDSLVSLCGTNGISSLLLECSKSGASLATVGSLTGQRPVQSNCWIDAGFKAKPQTSATVKTIIANRCRSDPESPLIDDSATICANHLKLLTDKFPVDASCSICRRALDVGDDDIHYVTAMQAERYARYFPNLVIGQGLCKPCFKRLLVVQGENNKRQARSELAVVYVLLKQKLLQDSRVPELVEGCRRRFLVALEKRRRAKAEKEAAADDRSREGRIRPASWTILADPRDHPFEIVETKVAPLRYLARSRLPRTAFPDSVVPSPTVREYIELVQYFKNSTNRAYHFIHTLNCHPLRDVMLDMSRAASFRELVSDGTAFLNVHACLQQVAAEAREDNPERAAELERRLCTFLQLSVANIVHCPDDFGKDEKFDVSVVYRDGESVRSLCLANASGDERNAPELKLPGRPPASFKFACLNLHHNSSAVSVHSTTSLVPSLRTMALGISSSSPPLASLVESLRSQLTCAGAIEIREAVSAVTNRGCDLQGVYLLWRSRRILPGGIIKAGFIRKVTEILKLINQLTERTLPAHPNHVSEVKSKVRRVLDSKFWSVDTDFTKERCGLWVDQERSSYVCCSCIYSDCDGGCVADFVASYTLTKSGSQKSSSHTANCGFAVGGGQDNAEDDDDEDDDYHDEAIGMLKLGDVRSLNEDDDEDAIIAEVDDSSFYYFSASGDAVIFDLRPVDLDAGKEYLETLDDPDSWRIRKGTGESSKIVLEYRGGEDEVTADIEVSGETEDAVEQQDAPRPLVRFSGGALQLFIDDLLPHLVEITSSKSAADGQFVDTSVDGGPSSFHLMATPEFVAVDEDGMKSSNATGPKQCEVCNKTINNINYYYTHVKRCQMNRLPRDVLAEPRDRKGKFVCPGCRRKFSTFGLCYMKHIFVCDKVKFGGFPCPRCRAGLSSENGLKRHMYMCRGRRKRPYEYDYNDYYYEDEEPTAYYDATPYFKSSRGRRGGGGSSSSSFSSSSRHGDESGQSKSLKIESVVSLHAANGGESSKPTVRIETVYHKIVSKVGEYPCPLCSTVFRLNQSYGKHLQSQECVKDKKDKKAPDSFNKLNMVFVTIHPGKRGSDSTIAHGKVSPQSHSYPKYEYII